MEVEKLYLSPGVVYYFRGSHLIGGRSTESTCLDFRLHNFPVRIEARVWLHLSIFRGQKIAEAPRFRIFGGLTVCVHTLNTTGLTQLFVSIPIFSCGVYRNEFMFFSRCPSSSTDSLSKELPVHCTCMRTEGLGTCTWYLELDSLTSRTVLVPVASNPGLLSRQEAWIRGYRICDGRGPLNYAHLKWAWLNIPPSWQKAMCTTHCAVPYLFDLRRPSKYATPSVLGNFLTSKNSDCCVDN